MKKLVCFLLILSTNLLSGCMHHHLTPARVPLEVSEVPVISTKNSVSVQTSLTEVPENMLVHSHGAHQYEFTTNDLNNYACKSLTAMLKKNNIVVSDNSQKKFAVDVVSAHSDIMPFMSKVTAIIKVKTGDNIVREFSGTEISKGLTTSVSQAINNALVEMLKDKYILDYLVN